MAEDGPRHNGFSPGLAAILNEEEKKDSYQKSRLVSYHDDICRHSVERALEHVFDLPYKSIHPLARPVDSAFIRSAIWGEGKRFEGSPGGVCRDAERDGICIGSGTDDGVVLIDKASICGEIRSFRQQLLIESLAVFSSARANAFVWKGKWMYEVLLETCGVQQLGWATLSCPFTDQKGVGDAEDSYAFDGKRVKKWNKDAETYGQAWVVGDVIGCCIDLDCNEISYYRNGVSLGVAFAGIRNQAPGLGYYPAISLSQGERCNLNFGAHPFRYPIHGFLPIQAAPVFNFHVDHLLRCFLRLLEMQNLDRVDTSSVEKLRRLKRFASPEDVFNPIAYGICEELFSIIDQRPGGAEYIAWGPVMSFLLEVFGMQAPHDYSSLDRVLDLFLEFPGSRPLFLDIISALSCSCKTAPLVLTECPYSGSYPYLALACHALRREELMILCWKSGDYESLLEGFLSRKGPSKQDLQLLIPSVSWPGSCEDMSSENSMILTMTALSGAVNKIEEMHRELCCLVIQFIPPITPTQLPGSLFRTFVQNLILRNRGADRSLPPPGVSSNSVLVSLYTVILHFLSEGFPMGDICGWIKGSRKKGGIDEGFLHRGGQQRFPIGLFLRTDPHRTDISRIGGSFNHLVKSYPVRDRETDVVQWEEGCMDDQETKVTHTNGQKPCCCSNFDVDFCKMSKDPVRHVSKGSRGHCSSIPERSAQVAAECSTGSLNDEIVEKPSSSDQSESEFGYRPIRTLRTLPSTSHLPSATLREEELLDAILLLYQLGLAPNFKQASYYMSHQSQLISLLDETDKQIRERSANEELKRLKEARNVYRDELIDCVRQCAWFRITLCSRWKQRGMYAACMWIVHLLLVLSKMDSVFIYVPEFYLEALVDCFHALRRSDPPFVSSSIFIKQGLASFVTFVVTHFNDPRISSADLRDLLLQSISVLVQYKDYLVAFESNEAAIHQMPRALLAAFDNRSWIPVTNILLRLCKGSGSYSSKHGETSSSALFQVLLCDVCIQDKELFSAFINRLFNTLSWTMTEFSVSIREMQESYQVVEMQQRKSCVIFDLSCSLVRVLELYTSEIPEVFLLGPEMNLRRLTELIVFILNHIATAADAEFFELLLRRQFQTSEKINRAMILAPLVGIIVNLMDASSYSACGCQNDVVGVFASMDCPALVQCGFQYLLAYNRSISKGTDASLARVRLLEKFAGCLTEALKQRESDREVAEETENCCCICYACQSDAQFEPCRHISCFGCITRHLLNSKRCFFCNAAVVEVVRIDDKRK